LRRSSGPRSNGRQANRRRSSPIRRRRIPTPRPGNPHRLLPLIVINDGPPLVKPTGPSMRIAPFFGGVVLSSLCSRASAAADLQHAAQAQRRMILSAAGIITCAAGLYGVGTCSSRSWPLIVINDGPPLVKPTGPSMRIAPFFPSSTENDPLRSWNNHLRSWSLRRHQARPIRPQRRGGEMPGGEA
jgi:hypothetical protein